jgi:hypothetical protein
MVTWRFVWLQGSVGEGISKRVVGNRQVNHITSHTALLTPVSALTPSPNPTIRVFHQLILHEDEHAESNVTKTVLARRIGNRQLEAV